MEQNKKYAINSEDPVIRETMINKFIKEFHLIWGESVNTNVSLGVSYNSTNTTHPTQKYNKPTSNNFFDEFKLITEDSINTKDISINVSYNLKKNN